MLEDNALHRSGGQNDQILEWTHETIWHADPDGTRAASVFRSTFDQLYDGQHTGRYRWDQLFKTEKTHYGTLIEINLRREFDDILEDGVLLDYRVDGHEIDCKYSQKQGGWMLPPEAFDQLILVCTASDLDGTWSMGIVRVTEENRRTSVNRDGKTGLNQLGRSRIKWLHHDAELPPNVLLGADPLAVDSIFSPKSGQQRLNQLFRVIQNKRIGRNTIATVAQQDDYMKRVRSNGGSRSLLRREGIIIPSGDYLRHREIAEQLGAEIPMPGEVVSIRVAPAHHVGPGVVDLDGQLWRAAITSDPMVDAPLLPDVRQIAQIRRPLA